MRKEKDNQYRLVLDNPKDLIGTKIVINDKASVIVEKIIRKDTPYTIFQVKNISKKA